MEALEQNERNFVRQTESLMREILVLQNFFKAMVTLTVKSPSGAVYYFANDAESLLLVNKSGLLGEKSFFINPALTKFSSNEKQNWFSSDSDSSHNVAKTRQVQLQDSCNEPTQEVPSRILEKKSTTRNIKPPALYPHRGGVGSASNVQEFTFRRCLTEEDEHVHSEVMRSSFEASDVIHDTKAFVPIPVARANLVQLPVELENLFTFHDTSPFCFTADPPSTFCSPNPQRVDHVTQRSCADSGFINFKERFSFSELMRSSHSAANTSGGKCLSAKRNQNFSSISTLRMRPRGHEVDAESLHMSKTIKLDPKSSNKKNSRKKSSSRLKKKLKKSQTKCVAPEKDTSLSREVLEVFDRVFSPNNLDTDAKFASHIAKHERREQGMDASNLLTQYSGLAGLNKKLVSAFPNKKVRRIFVYKALENSKFLLVVETQVGLALKRRQMQGKGHFTVKGACGVNQKHGSLLKSKITPKNFSHASTRWSHNGFEEMYGNSSKATAVVPPERTAPMARLANLCRGAFCYAFSEENLARDRDLSNYLSDMEERNRPIPLIHLLEDHSVFRYLLKELQVVGPSIYDVCNFVSKSLVKSRFVSIIGGCVKRKVAGGIKHLNSCGIPPLVADLQ